MDRDKLIEIIAAARSLYARDTEREESGLLAWNDKYDALADLDDAKQRLDEANEAIERLEAEEKEIAAEYWKLINEDDEERALVEWVYEQLDEDEEEDSLTVEALVRLYEHAQADGGEE